MIGRDQVHARDQKGRGEGQAGDDVALEDPRGQHRDGHGHSEDERGRDDVAPGQKEQAADQLDDPRGDHPHLRDGQAEAPEGVELPAEGEELRHRGDHEDRTRGELDTAPHARRLPPRRCALGNAEVRWGYAEGELTNAARIAVMTRAQDTNATRDRTGGMARRYAAARTDQIRPRADDGRARRRRYQAWLVPQCGHATEVETAAWKTRPQLQLYCALSIGPPDSRARRSWECCSAGAGGGVGAAGRGAGWTLRSGRRVMRLRLGRTRIEKGVPVPKDAFPSKRFLSVGKRFSTGSRKPCSRT